MAGGRPKKEIDYEMVGRLAAIQCTEEEIGIVLDIDKRTLQRDKEFCRLFNIKKQEGKASLRRMQWKKAESGNATMLIFLGKQYLGQADKQELTGKDGGAIEIDSPRDRIERRIALIATRINGGGENGQESLLSGTVSAAPGIGTEESPGGDNTGGTPSP